eukprot:CAMPEP_0197015488 /NCGR_PEP_ID=MMETSP1380-20130617/74346_1 /TAXON_ID=5936 /ORGANISM="Euplotes crassus, Strain CT5" /LENGTH=624 /DNA_ID=CAMNT_0042441429 /DNA_START=256 /DNA_END=2131 /DNA_ORIENTATION=+
MGVNIEQKKKSAPRAGGFRISIKKKKNRLEELKKLKNLNADSQGRWVPAPAAKEIAQPNREEVKNQNNNLQRQSSSRVTKRKPLVRLKKPPQSDLADRPIRGKIPGNHIPPLENRQGTKFERFMLEESKSEQFTNLEEHNQLPVSHINNEFSNRPEETSEEEKYYHHRIVQEELQNAEQIISSEVAQKTENRTDSVQGDEGAEEVKKEFNKSGRSKRKKWDTGGSNKVTIPTNINDNVNPKTATQLSQLYNIEDKAAKQDEAINKIYAHIEEQKKLDEELQKKATREKVSKPIPPQAPPKNELFSVDSLLNQIGGTDPDESRESSTKKKKASIKKVNNIVERLSQPKTSQPRRDPDEEELRSIMKKYDTTEKRIGGGGKKEFKYINPLPSQSSGSLRKKNIKFKPQYGNRDILDEIDEIEDEYQSSKMNTETLPKDIVTSQEDTLLAETLCKEILPKEETKVLDTLITTKSHLETNKISEHVTMVDNAMNEILGGQDERTFIEVNETNHATPQEEDKFTPMKEKSVKIMNDTQVQQEYLNIPVKDTPKRSSFDSLNERVILNNHLASPGGQSDLNERDIDLEEQYEQLMRGDKASHQSDNHGSGSDTDSLNDIDEDLTKLYTGL